MDWMRIVTDVARAALGPEAAVYALAAMGLNVHFGYAGLLNFGQAGYMMVGAYGVAITVVTFSGPLWLGVLVGLSFSLLLSLVLGLPTLRLRADYFAITSIAAAEIARLVFRSGVAEGVTGGVFGLQQFANSFYALNPFPATAVYGFGAVQYSSRRFWLILVAWGFVVLAAVLVWLLMRSPWGRVVRSIREDEEAARALGKNVYWYKMQSLLIGGIFGSVAGMLLATGQQAVHPDTYSAVVTFFAYTALILGGPGTVGGPIIGAMAFWGIFAGMESALRGAIFSGLIPAGLMSTEQVGVVRLALVGLGLMLLMAFRPQGMFGNREEMRLDAH